MKHRIFIIISILMLIFSISGCGNTESSEDTKPVSSTKATKATEETIPAKITVLDSIDGKIKITPFPDVKVNTLDSNLFYTDDYNRISYEDDKTYSLTGIDVSSYSGEIDWTAVKNDGVDFAIIRIGGRGYGTEGIIYEDTTALSNIKNAKNAGLDIGVYFYSQAVTVDEAQEEADFVIKQLGGIKLDLPIVYDFEFIEDDIARTDNITGAEMTEFAKVFCSAVENAGYSSMIYGESHDFYQRYNLQQLKNIPIWYAQYSQKPDFYYNFSMWQYSDSGNVAGIQGSVDMNLIFINRRI